jgi:DNA-binding response OmpR family regulator
MKEEQHKLLIIDDEPAIRDTYGDYFTKRGFMVETAADGVEGLDKLLPDEFDVALIDIKMPKMDGIEVIHQALADEPVDASIIVLTGHGDRNDAVQAINYGADAWFDKSKDFSMSELFKRVCELAEVIPPNVGKRLDALMHQLEKRT